MSGYPVIRICYICRAITITSMISVKRFVFNPFQVNGYLLYDESMEAIAVDPACSNSREEQELAGFLEANTLKLVRNINTHCHIDHILGNGFIEERFGIRPEYHRDGVMYLHAAREIAASFGMTLSRIPEPGSYLSDGETVTWGRSELRVLYTPGHAGGSCCLYSSEQGFVLTGDVLFKDSIGRTDLPGGDFGLLMKSINEKLFTLPGDTLVYPGHRPETTIGYEKINNPFITPFRPSPAG